MNSFYLLVPVLLPLALAFFPARHMPRLRNALPAITAAACLLLAIMLAGESLVLSVPWTGASEFKLRLTLSRWLYLFLLYALSLPPLCYHYLTSGDKEDRAATFCLLGGLAFAAVLILAGNPATFTLAWLLSGVVYFLFAIRGGEVAAQAAGLRLIVVHSFAGLLAGAGLVMSNNAVADMQIYGWTEASAARAQFIALALMLTAVFIKAGVYPFNGWSAEAGEYLPPAGSALCFGVWDKMAAVMLMLKAFSDAVPLAPLHGAVVAAAGAAAMFLAGVAAFFERRFTRMAFHASACGAGLIALACAAEADIFRFSCSAAAITVAAGAVLMFIAASELEASGASDCSCCAGALASRPMASVMFLAGGASVSGLLPFALFYPGALIISGLPVHLAPFALLAVGGQALCFGGFVKAAYAMRRIPSEGAELPPSHAGLGLKGVFVMAFAAMAALWVGVPVAVGSSLPEISFFGGQGGLPWGMAAVVVCSGLIGWFAYKAGRAAGEKPFLGWFGNLTSNPRWNGLVETLGRENLYLYPGAMHILFSFGKLLSSVDRVLALLAGTLPSYLTEVTAVVVSRLNRGQYGRRAVYLAVGIVVFLVFAILGSVK